MTGEEFDLIMTVNQIQDPQLAIEVIRTMCFLHDYAYHLADNDHEQALYTITHCNQNITSPQLRPIDNHCLLLPINKN